MNFLNAYPYAKVYVSTTDDWGRGKYIITLKIDYKERS